MFWFTKNIRCSLFKNKLLEGHVADRDNFSYELWFPGFVWLDSVTTKYAFNANAQRCLRGMFVPQQGQSS